MAPCAARHNSTADTRKPLEQRQKRAPDPIARARSSNAGRGRIWALLTHPWVGSLDQVGSCVGSTVEIFSVGRCRLDLGSQPVAGGRVATASSAACPLPAGEGRGTAVGGWPGRSGRIFEGGWGARGRSPRTELAVRLVGCGRAGVGTARRGRAWPSR